MVSAGRILILPKGDWNNLTSYAMLDLVTGSDNKAYLAKQASVGVDPTTDTTKTYWQVFGTTVAPDGTTIVDDGSGNISVNIDNDTIKYDSQSGHLYVDIDPDKALSDLTDVTITSATNGQVLTYDSVSGKWKNASVSVGTKADKTDLTTINESGSTASQNISAGQYFYLDGVLKRAKTDISNGDSFTASNMESGDNALNTVNDKGSVSVTADGVKTTSTLLNELYALIDKTKISYKSVLVFANNVVSISKIETNQLTFSVTINSSSNLSCDTYALKSTGSTRISASSNTSGTSFNNQSSTAIASGNILAIHY